MKLGKLLLTGFIGVLLLAIIFAMGIKIIALLISFVIFIANILSKICIPLFIVLIIVAIFKSKKKRRR